MSVNTNRAVFEVGDVVACVLGTKTLTEGTIYQIVERREIGVTLGGSFYTYTVIDQAGNKYNVLNGHLSFKKAA